MKIRIETTASFEIRLWLTEEEAHALYAISTYSAKDFHRIFTQHLGNTPFSENGVHEKDLIELFDRLRSMKEQFKAVQEARKTLTKNF